MMVTKDELIGMLTAANEKIASLESKYEHQKTCKEWCLHQLDERDKRIAKLEAEKRLHETIVTQLQRGQKAITDEKLICKPRKRGLR